MSIGAKIFYKPYIIVLKFGLYCIWSLSGVIQMPNQVGYGKLIYISPKGGKTSTHQNKSCYQYLLKPTHASIKSHIKTY